MIDLKEYTELKKKVAKAEKEASQAEGALQTVMAQLKDEFGCSSLEEAEAKLKELQRQAKQEELKYNKHLKQFKAKWNEKLNQSEDE